MNVVKVVTLRRTSVLCRCLRHTGTRPQMQRRLNGDDLQYIPKTPKNPKSPLAISKDRTSLMPKGKCSVLLYHIYTEAHRTVIPIRAKSMWKGWYPLPDWTISNLRRCVRRLRTIIAFHFQQSCGNVHQCTKELRYQNQKETFVSVPECLHPPFESSWRY
jgi:hypothetical protein